MMALRKLTSHGLDCRAVLRGAAALVAGMASYWTPFARYAAHAQEGPIRFGVSEP